MNCECDKYRCRNFNDFDRARFRTDKETEIDGVLITPIQECTRRELFVVLCLSCDKVVSVKGLSTADKLIIQEGLHLDCTQQLFNNHVMKPHEINR